MLVQSEEIRDLAAVGDRMSRAEKAEINKRKTGYRINELIAEKNRTVVEVARACDISVAAVYRWMEGICLPSIANLITIAKMLDKSVEELLVVEWVKE